MGTLSLLWTGLHPVIVMEGVLTAIFVGLLTRIWRRFGRFDRALWAVLWCTRTLASINGAGYLAATGSATFSVYVALQGSVALLLMVILLRYEFQSLKGEERGRVILLRMFSSRSDKVVQQQDLREPSPEQQSSPRVARADVGLLRTKVRS